MAAPKERNKKSHLSLIIFLQVAWHVYLSFFNAPHTACHVCMFLGRLMMLCTVAVLHSTLPQVLSLSLASYFMTLVKYSLALMEASYVQQFAVVSPVSALDVFFAFFFPPKILLIYQRCNKFTLRRDLFANFCLLLVLGFVLGSLLAS